MSTNLMRRCFRERRRIAVVALLVFAALKLAGVDPAALPLPAGLAAVGAGIAAGLVSVLAPPLRGYAEAAALASLAFAGLARAFPGSSVDLAGTAADGLVALGVWVGLLALAHGARRLVGVLPLARIRNPKFQARAGTRVDMFRLWYGLVPTPGMAARYGDPDVISIDDAGRRLGRVRLVTQRTGPPREVLLQLLDVDPPFHVRLRASETDRHGGIVAAGVSEIFLVELGPKRLVLFCHQFPDMPLGRAILAWLDDSPGRLLDRRLATIERRARAEDCRPAARFADPPDGSRGAHVSNEAGSGLAAPPTRTPAGAPTGPG